MPDPVTPPAGTPPAGTPPAGTPPAGTPPAGTPPAASWTDGLDAPTQAFVAERQWKGIGDALTSYRNLEKLTGVPPEQIIKLPKDMNETAMGEVYDRLGRPKSAADYKLAETVKGADPEFAKTASGWFHEAGLNASQANKVAAKWQAHVEAQDKATLTAYNAKVEADKLALKTEWGANHDAHIEMAKTAGKAFGMTDAHIVALERVMGYAGVHKFLANIGSKLGEAEFVQGGGKPGDFTGMTPERAQARIAELKSNAEFKAKFAHKDPLVSGEARAEMRRLEKIAYPGQQVI